MTTGTTNDDAKENNNAGYSNVDTSRAEDDDSRLLLDQLLQPDDDSQQASDYLLFGVGPSCGVGVGGSRGIVSTKQHKKDKWEYDDHYAAAASTSSKSSASSGSKNKGGKKFPFSAVDGTIPSSSDKVTNGHDDNDDDDVLSESGLLCELSNSHCSSNGEKKTTMTNNEKATRSGYLDLNEATAGIAAGATTGVRAVSEVPIPPSLPFVPKISSIPKRMIKFGAKSQLQLDDDFDDGNTLADVMTVATTKQREQEQEHHSNEETKEEEEDDDYYDSETEFTDGESRTYHTTRTDDEETYDDETRTYGSQTTMTTTQTTKSEKHRRRQRRRRHRIMQRQREKEKSNSNKHTTNNLSNNINNLSSSIKLDDVKESLSKLDIKNNMNKLMCVMPGNDKDEDKESHLHKQQQQQFICGTAMSGIHHDDNDDDDDDDDDDETKQLLNGFLDEQHIQDQLQKLEKHINQDEYTDDGDNGVEEEKREDTSAIGGDNTDMTTGQYVCSSAPLVISSLNNPSNIMSNYNCGSGGINDKYSVFEEAGLLLQQQQQQQKQPNESSSFDEFAAQFDSDDDETNFDEDDNDVSTSLLTNDDTPSTAYETSMTMTDNDTSREDDADEKIRFLTYVDADDGIVEEGEEVAYGEFLIAKKQHEEHERKNKEKVDNNQKSIRRLRREISKVKRFALSSPYSSTSANRRRSQQKGNQVYKINLKSNGNDNSKPSPSPPSSTNNSPTKKTKKNVKEVSFDYPMVTSIKSRPYTKPEEIEALYYSADQISYSSSSDDDDSSDSHSEDEEEETSFDKYRINKDNNSIIDEESQQQRTSCYKNNSNKKKGNGHMNDGDSYSNATFDCTSMSKYDNDGHCNTMVDKPPKECFLYPKFIGRKRSMNSKSNSYQNDKTTPTKKNDRINKISSNKSTTSSLPSISQSSPPKSLAALARINRNNRSLYSEKSVDTAILVKNDNECCHYLFEI